MDGQRVPLKPFIHDLIGGGVMGMLSALRGTDDARVIEIRIEPQESPGDEDER